MIADPRVFDDEFVPPDLLHRETEIERLLRRFMSPQKRHALISGPSGVGKTVLAMTATDRLREETGATCIQIRALGKTTPGILRAALEELPQGPDDVAQTTSTTETRRLFREAVDGTTIVVLDEGDDLPETDAIRELRAIEDVGVVPIAHDGTDWLSRLDVDDAHPLDNCHTELGRYTVNELADILEHRARQGFHNPEIAPRPQLETIADTVAGVARDGIQTLLASAEIAREQSRMTITDADVEPGYERAKHKIRIGNLGSLPFHHQILYSIVHEAGELTAGELHDRYDEITSIYKGQPTAPIGKRERRRKIPKLVDYDLVDHDGATRGRTYWVVDEGVDPVVELPTAVSR